MLEATAEARAFTERTQKYMEKQRQEMIDELRAEVARLAVKGAEKILKQSINPQVQQKAVEEMLRGLKNEI